MNDHDELVRLVDEVIGPMWVGDTAELDETVRDIIAAILPEVERQIKEKYGIRE